MPPRTHSSAILEKMSELTRGQRVEASPHYMNAHEVAAVCDMIATCDLTLCLDKKKKKSGFCDVSATAMEAHLNSHFCCP